jgi:copper chaperone CopZ
MSEHCHVEPIRKVATAEERASTTTAVLLVSGMGCPNCAARVRNSLLSINGAVEADVDHTLGTAKVTFNLNLTTVSALINAVAQAGRDGRHAYRAIHIGSTARFPTGD